MALKILVLVAVCTFASSLPDPGVNINVNINVGKAGSENTAVPKVVIDTDAGFDDAQAIFMILAAHKRGELEVVGITTVNGLTGVGNFTTNVLRVLETAQLLQIPVYSGSWTPLVRPWSWELVDTPPYCGYNGFGDVELAPAPSKKLLQEQPAAAALVEVVKKYEGSLILVGIGPLSNLAIAMRMDPHFTERLASLYIMGGNKTEYENITQCWNPNDLGLEKDISKCGEFNFYVDAESAQLVLENTKTKIHLVPNDTCLENPISHEYRLELGALPTAEARLLNKIEGIDIAVDTEEIQPWITYDQLAAAWMIDDIRNKDKDTTNKTELLVNKTKECYGIVQLEELCRGHMVVDNMNPLEKPNNLIIMEDINMYLYKIYLSTAFGLTL